ncbi:MAG TPA: FAD-dependent oxidoreductase, partial [Mycobacterium sp.]|nr:FAD-dependent oxidoreductase [Mycobacterium sp.]
MSDVVVLGSGFAGLWAALGAARRIDELGVGPGEVNITVVSSLPFHDIRVRNYEADLTACRIPLRDVLDPVAVEHVAADVTAIDPGSCTVATTLGTRAYDRLVMALGSRVVKPDVPGLDEFGFDVDTYDGALRLQRHLVEVAGGLPTLAAATAIVVGAGLTGIETACELPARLATLFPDITPRVILVDHNRHVGSDMGASARPVIEAALTANGVQTRLGVGVAAIGGDGVALSTGEWLAASTVVWCAGMRASPLTADLGVECDGLGRVAVDEHLRVINVRGVFAAGDVAAAWMDDGHLSVMSCQHGRPMGRFAGYNVISDLLGEPMLSLRIPWYVTVL